MTQEEKNILITNINSKYPHNNIMELYYDAGRALPIIAQRFPDGRVSDWYRSQYVEVIKVMPNGKHGKYGKAFGFYYRNGEREDTYWCKRDDVKPQIIPNSGCGSWMLLDIKGEPSSHVPILGVDDVMDFGKYKGIKLREVVEKDWQYIEWAVSNSHKFNVNMDSLQEYHKSCVVCLKPSDEITFGKYKGQVVAQVYKSDPQYLRWLENNNNSFRVDWPTLEKT